MHLIIVPQQYTMIKYRQPTVEIKIMNFKKPKKKKKEFDHLVVGG